MILVDTSVWIDHLRASDSRLAASLNRAQVLVHPFVIGELAMGSLRNRAAFIAALSDLPQCTAAAHDEVLAFVDRHDLFGQGLSYIGAHLLAAVRLHPGTTLWTRDRRLRTAATDLDIVDRDGA